MTAKDLLKWKIEPLAGAFSSPLQPLLQQLQKQLESGQFSDALRSLHDSFVFLTMLYGGIAVGSLRSVTPLGPDLTLLLDEKPSAEIWARLLRQSWLDWNKHPHHPALEAIRGVFFLGSRLQSSRLGARRHSRWLGMDARASSNGESFGGWTDTIRKAKNINPEAAARQLVMKLPLLNIWLRSGQEFLSTWTLRLDPRQDSGEFRYLLNREDCRFDTQPNLSLDQLLLRIELNPQGEFSVSNQVAEATPPAPPTPVAATTPPSKPAEVASKGDVGLQWDPVTKSYRLVGGAAKPSEPAVAPPVVAETPAPVPPVPAVAPPPPVAPVAAETASKANVAVEWDAASNSYKMVAKPPAQEAAKPAPPPPADDIDAMLQAELQSLEELLSDDPLAELATPGPTPETKSTTPFADIGDMGLDFLMGDSPPPATKAPPTPSKVGLGPPPTLETRDSLDELLAADEAVSEPSLEELLGEDPKPSPSLEEMLGDEPAVEPSLEEMLGDEPAVEPPPAVVALPPVTVKPPTFKPSVKTPSTLGPPPVLEDLLADEPPAPVMPPVVEAAPSLDDLLADDEPPAPIAPPVVEAAPSLDDLLADEPAPVVPPLGAAIEVVATAPAVEPPQLVPALATGPSDAGTGLDELLSAVSPAVVPPLMEALETSPAVVVEPDPIVPSLFETPTVPVVAPEDSPSVESILGLDPEPPVPAPPPTTPVVVEPVPEPPSVTVPDFPAPPPVSAGDDWLNSLETPVQPVAPPLPPVIVEVPVEPVAPVVVEAPVEPVAPPPPVVVGAPVEPVVPPPPVVVEAPVEPVAPPPAVVVEAPVEPVAPPPPVVVEAPVEPIAPPPPVVVEAPVEPVVPPPPVVVEAPVEPVAPPPPVVVEAPVEPVVPPPPVVIEAPVEPVAPPPPVVVEAPVEPVVPPPPVVVKAPMEPVAPPPPVVVEAPVAPPPPVVAEVPIVPPAVEIGTVVAAATAASVLVPHLPAEASLTVIPVEEEIEEYDTYQFDPNSGPPAPPWQPWNSADRAVLDEVTQSLQERMAHFDFAYLLEQVRGFINKGRSGYLLIEGESGVGKSYLGSYLESTAPQVHPRGIRIAYLKTARRPHGDYEVFIETVNDQIQASNTPRTHRIQPLDRLALQDLAVQYPSEKRQGRFAAFATLLTVQNRGPVLLYIDEIDRRHEDGTVSPADYLPEQLPDNVYVVITHRPDAPEGFLSKLKALQATRFTLEPVAADYRKQLDSDLAQIIQAQPTRASVLQANEYRLHYSRLAGQAAANGLTDPQTKFQELYATITKDLRAQRPDRFHALQHFLMTLCAAFEPMSWDDIDQWGSSVETVKELVDLLPATLLQQKLGMFLTVDIAHESLRDFLINQNQEAFQDVCRILCGWTVHNLQQAGELKLQSEQGREWARANFYRLYRWSLLSKDLTTLEWVVRNKELQKKRIAVSQALETSARPHQKLGLLDLWVECLRELTEEHDRKDLCDELAWALNSRGLTYLTLHRRQRALADLDRSVELFDRLVNKDRQTQFRNGLAAAYNRRSEIHFALHEYDLALKDSTESVQLFTDLVEDMGREDLQPLLAYAHRNQSSVWAAKHNLDEANRSMEAAIKLFVKLSQGADETKYAKDQAACHLQLAQQRQRARQHQESLSESGKAVAMLSQLSEKDAGLDVRAILERAHFARGISYLATDQADKAQRDFTKSITLSTQLVDEGRLDHRDELAEAFSQRGKTQLSAKQPKEGLRDFSKAIELRQKLVNEGRSDQTLALAQEFIERAEVYRVDKQEEACQSDLTAALNLLRNESGEVTSLLLQVHRQKAHLGLQLGRYTDVVEDADQALKLLKSTLTGDPEQEAQLYSLRGESSRRLLHSEKARQDFESAVKIYTDLLQNKGGSTYLLGLAEAYGDLARVSLTTGHLDRAQEEVNRSVEAVEVASKDNQDCRALLAQAYSTRAEVLERQGQHQTARQELQKTLGIYSKLVEAEGQSHLLDEQALAYRRLGRTLLSLNESNPARDALENATKRYKELWSKDRKGPWLDEISRTQVVNSAVSVTLKEYGAAEEEIQRSQEHFSGLLDQGKVEYFNDVFQTSLQRARNFVRVGMHAKAGDELTRLLDLLKRTAAQFEQVDFRESQARVLQAKAGVSSSLQQFEQAYNDFETAIQTLQPLVVQESQFHLGRDLADMYRQRAKMLISAGHAQPGIADLSQAAQVLSILLSQGREELRLPLAQVAQERAAAYLSQSELVAGVEDLNLGIELLMSLASSNDPEVFAMLAQMLAQRGRCFQQAQQSELASADFEKAVQLYSRLVEQQGRQDLSSVLAECLLSHLSLSGQGVEDPQRLQALVKAVRLVTQQTKDGKPAEESFVVDAVTAVRNSLVQRPDQANSELVDSVLKLSEAILQVPRINYNWVGLTQLLSECYGALETYKGPKYVSFICLSCVSCGREVGSVGAASLPRLIYFLTLLGITLGSERPGEQLGLVGNAFTNLLEQLARQRLDESQALSLRQLVTTWQQLPAGYPAAANVSRGVLTNLLRAT